MCHNHSSINTQVQWKDWWCIMSIVSALCLVPCNTVLQWSHIFTRCTKMFLIWLITQVSMNMLMLTRNITQGAASHYKLWFDCCVVCVVLCCVVLCCVVLCCVVLCWCWCWCWVWGCEVTTHPVTCDTFILLLWERNKVNKVNTHYSLTQIQPILCHLKELRFSKTLVFLYWEKDGVK